MTSLQYNRHLLILHSLFQYQCTKVCYRDKYNCGMEGGRKSATSHSEHGLIQSAPTDSLSQQPTWCAQMSAD